MPHRIVLPAFDDIPDPQRRSKLEASARTLAGVLASRPRFRDAEVHAIMKGMPGRVVAEVTLRGERRFVKLLIGWHAEAAIREMLAELRFAEENSAAGGRYRVARAVDAAPRLGLIVLEAAPGMRLDDVIEAADPHRRNELHRHCGAWLSWYCAPRRESRPFDAERFLRDHRIRARPPAYAGEIADEDRPRRDALERYIKQRSRALNGRRVSIAASHGDFLPRNLHVSGSTVTAYDIEGLRRLPVAADAARFLVHQQMRQGFASDDLTCGITRSDWTAFLESGVLDPEERDDVLPLFVAQQMAVELPTLGFRPNWLRRMRRSIDAFLQSGRAFAQAAAQLAWFALPVI